MASIDRNHLWHAQPIIKRLDKNGSIFNNRYVPNIFAVDASEHMLFVMKKPLLKMREKSAIHYITYIVRTNNSGYYRIKST
jgi:hypothetical protein